MNSFDAMGQAQLDAAEGNRLLASALMRWLSGAVIRLFDTLGRHLPESKTAPW